MASEHTDVLTTVLGELAALRGGQVEISRTLEAHGRILWQLSEQVGAIIEKLTPEVSDGPTMQELLAELVARVGDNGTLLRRIDRCTDSMATNLPGDVVRAMKPAAGASGNGTWLINGGNGGATP